ENTAAAADPMVPRVARVLRRRRDLKDVATLDLEMEDGGDLAFAPGQFNMLTMFGVGEVAISISGDPAKPGGGLVHTIRDVSAVSGALMRLGPGSTVGLRGPFGLGWPLADAKGRDVVVLAGGLGLAPLRPVIYSLLANRRDYGKIALLYGARGPGEILFRAELEQWRRLLDIEVLVTVDHADADWHGSVGVVTTLIPRADFDPQHTLALVCGPEVLMRFGSAVLRDVGVSDKSIYVSMERSMKCAVGLCGHCQVGPVFVCRDGPVFRSDQAAPLMAVKEL
ncbi:MAG TPA: FAD/NAD(P)-binding protein, partial [Rhizomicrobium sp.]